MTNNAHDTRLTIYSPVAGLVRPLTDVPDPVFAEKMLGDGLAVEPSSNTLYAPMDGVVKTLHKAFHALVIEKDGVEILIHVGVETVNMHGEGFKAFVSKGSAVKKGDKLLEFDRDLISKRAQSNFVIVIVANQPEVKIFTTSAKEAAPGQPLFALGAAVKEEAPAPAARPPQPELCSDVITIQNKNGFHARPASVLAKLAAGFEDTDIFIVKNNTRANAKSMVEILGLGIDFGDKISFCASGARQAQALEEVTAAILKGLNEGARAQTGANKPKPDFSKEAQLSGVNVFPGLVLGKAFIYEKEEIKVEEYCDNPEKELNKLYAAVEAVTAALKAEIEAAAGHTGKTEILEAHLTMLGDPVLRQTSRELVKSGKCAAFACRAATQKGISVLQATGNKLLQERADDYKDVEARLIFALTGKKQTAPVFGPDTILIMRNMLPYELAYINQNVKGIALAGGSPTSHVSIMLKNMGVPSIISLGGDIMSVPQGADVIINSELGTITINPSNIEEVKKQQQIKAKARAENRARALEPAITKDGVEIRIKGNVGTLDEAQKAAALGAKGLGLVRSEFLFAGNAVAPTEEEQYKLYQQIADSQNGQSVIIRTLDVGGDKPLAFMPIEREENPIMGLRGVRNYSLDIEIFKSQVRAILRVTPCGAAKIMLPMIGFTGELAFFREIIAKEAAALGVKDFSVGIMVEVPSAALMAGEFARQADFLSLGTNDLTQYALAIDRGHPSLSSYADTLNPAVLKLIAMTAEGGAKHGKPVGVCGAAASDLVAVPLLIGLGVSDLSVVGPLIPDVKAFIRTLDFKECRDMARAALNMQQARQTREMVKARFKL
ncbi:MAG: phosphoenolpyruvate--protein phosphotransferase [Elusimicrobiota bacterium]|jgi:phosphoenolpyruvate-protein phosphotransferase|nr:phosphoenolpyruvate--protein phosphotransferase [Elusimicrobiota bacterium]